MVKVILYFLFILSVCPSVCLIGWLFEVFKGNMQHYKRSLVLTWDFHSFFFHVRVWQGSSLSWNSSFVNEGLEIIGNLSCRNLCWFYYDILTCCYFAFFPFLYPAPVYLLLLCCLRCRYRPSVAVSFVESELGFTEDKQCLKFLQDLGVVFTADGSKIDCKQSQGVVGASWADPSRLESPCFDPTSRRLIRKISIKFQLSEYAVGFALH